ncbi:MAG: ATP-binding protein, partial [Myxococcota bacterium]
DLMSEPNEEYEIQHVFDHALAELMSRDLALKRSGRASELVVDASLPRLEGNRHRMRQIIEYLLDNAFRYSLDGTPVRARARLEYEGRGEELVVEIEDEGVGIATEHHQEIFAPLWRVDSSTTRDTDGIGLSLHIARQMAQGMGGSLRVRSTLGEGSTFVLRVPAVRAAGELET